MGRGLKYSSSGWFTEHWTLNCLHQPECSDLEKDSKGFLPEPIFPPK